MPGVRRFPAGLKRAAVFALPAAFVAAAAGAQSFVAPPCAAVLAGTAAPAYDNPAHAAWYRRFWSGSCAGVPGFCMSGQPKWNDEVQALAARAAPDAKAAVSDRACRLGRTIGLEWARDNAVRRLSTADLRALSAMLDAPGAPEDRLAAAEARVGQLMR